VSSETVPDAGGSRLGGGEIPALAAGEAAEMAKKKKKKMKM
jgi:hypothetical protein